MSSNPFEPHAFHGHAPDGESSEGAKNPGFSLHAPVEDISEPLTPPAPKKAPRAAKGVKEPRAVYMETESEDDEPDLDAYFSGFPTVDKKRKVAICRGYAAYLSASRQLPGKKSRK